MSMCISRTLLHYQTFINYFLSIFIFVVDCLVQDSLSRGVVHKVEGVSVDMKESRAVQIKKY